MSFEDLSTFLLVLELGSLSRAAERLDVSKSIVSRRISELEAELGVALLSRTTRHISPTAAGLQFHFHASRILNELADAQENLKIAQSEVSGRLRLSAPLSFGIEILAPAIATFAQKHPKLEIDLAYSDRFVDLVAEGFDACVRIGQLQDSSLISRRMGTSKMILAASPDYLEKYGEPRTPRDLSKHEYLLYSASPRGNSLVFQDGQRRIKIKLHGRFRADNGEALRAAAIASLGIVALPDFMIERAIKDGSLRPILTQMPLEEGGIYLLRPKGGAAPLKLRALYDHLMQSFGARLADSF